MSIKYLCQCFVKDMTEITKMIKLITYPHVMLECELINDICRLKLLTIVNDLRIII